MTTPGYKNLRFEYNLSADDPWGDALTWHFAIAETLFHYGFSLPSEWQFRDSILHDSSWIDRDSDEREYVEDFIVTSFQEGTVDSADLFEFANVLFRYLGILRAAGKDY